MNTLGRNAAIQVIMRCAAFPTFLVMRLVCKQWERWSRDSILHWYNWLCDYGPREPWVLKNHNWMHCENGGEGKCRVRHHYLSTYHPPKLLLTVPLCDQVFSIGARKMEKRLEKHYRYYFERVAELEMQRKHAELQYKHYAKWREHNAVAVEKHFARLANRKRRRISKPGE